MASDGNIPAPLSAIFTPKVGDHEGNSGRLGAPKYFGSFAPPQLSESSNLGEIQNPTKRVERNNILHTSSTAPSFAKPSDDALAKAISEANIPNRAVNGELNIK